MKCLLVTLLFFLGLMISCKSDNETNGKEIRGRYFDDKLKYDTLYSKDSTLKIADYKEFVMLGEEIDIQLILNKSFISCNKEYSRKVYTGSCIIDPETFEFDSIQWYDDVDTVFTDNQLNLYFIAGGVGTNYFSIYTACYDSLENPCCEYDMIFGVHVVNDSIELDSLRNILRPLEVYSLLE